MTVFGVVRSILLFLTAVAMFGCRTIPTAEERQLPSPLGAGLRPALILISIDGLRPADLSLGVSPNLNNLAGAGVTTDAMRPSFPSTTFPNHYSLVTGQRPDAHGLVANTMTDPALPGRFAVSTREGLTDPRWWEQAEPIWVSAERAGLRTATMFWPGSEVDIGGVRPSDWRTFDNTVSAQRRVETVLDWLSRSPEHRPRFVTIYFNAVDQAGHRAGPGSQPVKDALREIDLAVGRLTAELRAGKVNADVIVVSDHGMASIASDRAIRFDHLVPDGSARWVSGGAYAVFDAIPGAAAQLEQAVLGSHQHMSCWKKSEIPVRYHYGRNQRVPEYLCLADVGWRILNGPERPGAHSGGDHGYDNYSDEMAAVFIAAGPSFLRGYRIPRFDNVEVYPMMMHLLDISPPSDIRLAPPVACLALKKEAAPRNCGSIRLSENP